VYIILRKFAHERINE